MSVSNTSKFSFTHPKEHPASTRYLVIDNQNFTLKILSVIAFLPITAPKRNE